MNSHLAPRHIVEAIDGTLAPAEEIHLRGCAACRAEVDLVRAILKDAEGAAPVPDPSPLFWDHFSERVREATSTMPVAGPSWWESWREKWSRPVALAGAALAVVALVVLVRPTPSSSPPSVVAGADAWPALEGEGWELVVSLTEELEWDEMTRVAPPKAGTADALIDELSPQERAAFVKLLKQEMGGLE